MSGGEIIRAGSILRSLAERLIEDAELAEAREHSPHLFHDPKLRAVLELAYRLGWRTPVGGSDPRTADWWADDEVDDPLDINRTNFAPVIEWLEECRAEAAMVNEDEGGHYDRIQVALLDVFIRELKS